MADLKRITPEKILWIDLEMTGLNPQVDKILEVAAIITDWNFKELEKFESGVGQAKAEIEALLKANPFAQSRPAETQKLIDLSLKSPPQAEVEMQLFELVNRHFPDNMPALLGGNSIHTDRGFIRASWSKLEARLHYRMLDVSAWKVVMIGKYEIEFPKRETHRALDDIRESIDELKHYTNLLDLDHKTSIT